MGYPILQNQTAQPLIFLMVLSSDHISPATGKSPTVTLSKNGAAFAAPSGAVTEIGNGWYKVAGNATDSNTLGPLALHATEASSDPCDDTFPVIAYNPQDSAALGLTLMPSNLQQWKGSVPNGVIGGRVDANAQVVADKTAYALSSAGLDSVTVTEPTGRASTFPAMLVQLWMRFMNKVTQTSSAQTVLKSDQVTTSVTGSVSDDGTTQVKGHLS